MLICLLSKLREFSLLVKFSISVYTVPTSPPGSTYKISPFIHFYSFVTAISNSEHEPFTSTSST